MTDLAQKIISGDLRALARAATWVESGRPEAETLLTELFPRTGKALVVGITGAPGAGKSTLVDQLIAAFRSDGKSVAVIAVDPSSPFSGGALLGDRIRMQRHHADPHVFIRSMATRGWMGGLSRTATEMTLLLDAAGCDVILVETVGVGQDEVEVARLAGVTVVVLVPGMGDDVQAIKAGIMEIAHVFAINKADQPGAAQLERDLHTALSLGSTPMPEIVSTVAPEGRGIAELIAAIRRCEAAAKQPEREAQLWAARLKQMLRDRWMDGIPEDRFRAAGQEVAARRRDPFTIVREWLEPEAAKGEAG